LLISQFDYLQKTVVTSAKSFSKKSIIIVICILLVCVQQSSCLSCSRLCWYMHTMYLHKRHFQWHCITFTLNNTLICHNLKKKAPECYEFTKCPFHVDELIFSVTCLTRWKVIQVTQCIIWQIMRIYFILIVLG